jgi:hypothetical protein
MVAGWSPKHRDLPRAVTILKSARPLNEPPDAESHRSAVVRENSPSTVKNISFDMPSEEASATWVLAFDRRALCKAALEQGFPLRALHKYGWRSSAAIGRVWPRMSALVSLTGGVCA